MSDVKLYLGDNLEGMRSLPNESVDLTVTSPPYDNLRTYGGHQWDFCGVANELYRLTKQGGVVVWVVGDETVNGSETGTSFRQALYFMECGFNLHDTMIYMKHNFAKPESNRYHQIFEYMFVLSRGKPKTFNPIFDKPNSQAGKTNWGRNTHRQRNGSQTESSKRVYADMGKRLNVWKYNTGFGFAGDVEMYNHPAPFPELLARDHIVSWSNKGDVVLDPFMGSGTTAKMCRLLARNFIGYEINPTYFADAELRVNKTRADLGEVARPLSHNLSQANAF